ncbi:hypothetical protein Anas_03037 [Armadillidium nasatum]|uniref:Uncharacterized protein n=1 Tax=Armadillidium nasatum TaxID=96803 RepID=A0A5N5TL78_9CRUS|nr:hypothetical protein Anas_03037 [Armadillidium nasatum]
MCYFLPKLADDFYIVYSDLDIGISHPDLYDLDNCSSSSDTMPSTSPYSSTSTFGEKKRTAPSKANAVPSPPRRLSSKWHPSLLKSNQIRKSQQSVVRSTSAERVRETRALYSSWHREMVAKSRERIASPPSRSSSSLDIKKKKDIENTRKNFLLDRRAVSESRFTLQDKQTKESTYSKRFRSATAEIKKTENTQAKRSVSKEIKDVLKKDTGTTKGKDTTSSKLSNHIEKPPPSSRRYYSSLERPPKPSTGKTEVSRSAGTSPSRSMDSQRWSHHREGRGGLAKHTVSSLSKIKCQQPFLANVKPRSHSADEGGKTIRHANCLASKSAAALPPKKSSTTKREVTHHLDKTAVKSKEPKRSLEPSESFDTTHSNETGYCSMLDLSPSPIADQKTSQVPSPTRKEGKYDIGKNSNIDSSDRTIPHAATLPRRYEPRAHSAPAPGLRTRSSAFFYERLEKWQTLTKESVDRPPSRTSTRSNSPLRSLELVKKVSSSFKNIPTEVDTIEVPFIRCRSLETLCPSPHSHPKQYREYILELKNAVMKSPRISQLRQLFDSLEKIHKLERSVSTAEISSYEKRKCDVIDFEAWKNLRDSEKKALEYHILVKQLDDAKKEREFLYNVSPSRKWSGDCRLRGKEKYVSELKNTFDTLAKDETHQSVSRRGKYESEKDTYRGLWRGSSVRDLTKNIGSGNRGQTKRGSSLSLTREDSAFRPKGLWTSLSLEQINALREQLTEIYGSMQSIRSWRQKREKLRQKDSLSKTEKVSYINAGDASTSFKEASKAIRDTVSNIHQRPVSINTLETNIVRDSKDTSLKSTNKLEEQRKRLSKQLSIELQEKVAEQRSHQEKAYLSPPERPHSISPESLSRSSPRTCYSLDVSDSSEPTSLTSNLGDQFLLVVRKPKRSNSLPNGHTSDGESSDSDASIKTVIHKDVAGKVKFFEKKARKSSRSSDRQSFKGSCLSIDPSEVPHYATLPLRHKKSQQKTDILKSDYLPVRSASTVTLNYNPSIYDSQPKIYQETVRIDSSRENSIDTSYSRSYLLHVKTGDVDKLKERYERTEAKRSKSLPDIKNSISSRITPTDRTVVRGQEIGDVKYTRAKYEVPRKMPSSERWQLPKDEYLPKSKLANTFYSLSSRSPYFNEPQTIERISRRESVEKSPLRRIHTGVVEQVIDKFEGAKPDSVSIVGEMFTSAPSIPELMRLSPLVPPRPPLPNIPPKKPLRSASYSPRRLPKIPSPSRPIKTSTPYTSPPQRLDRSLSFNYPKTERHFSPPPQTKSFPPTSTTYDVTAHIPKFRYTPVDSYGASKWTQSLERPSRLLRLMSDKREPLPKRTQSFSPPPRTSSNLKYGVSRSISPPQQQHPPQRQHPQQQQQQQHHQYQQEQSQQQQHQPYVYGYGKHLVPPYPRRYSHAFYPPQPPPIPSPPSHYYPTQPTEKAQYRDLSPQSRYSLSSVSSTHSARARMRSPPRIKSPPPYSSSKETLERAQNAFREMKNIISTYIPPPNKVVEAISKYERPISLPSESYYKTYPSRGTQNLKSSYEAQRQNPKLSTVGYYGTIPPRNTNLSRETSSKSVTFKAFAALKASSTINVFYTY